MDSVLFDVSLNRVLDLKLNQLTSHLSELLFQTLSKMRFLFYLVLPSESTFKSVGEVPRYVVEMFPCFILLSVIENGVRLLQGRGIMRPNDTIASISQGVLQECVRINVRSFEVLVYSFVYLNFRIFDFSWDSKFVWFLALLGVDLGFYIYHRLSHEVNILWAVHQAHHSNEDFSMISSLRQAVFQPFVSWFAYLPMALIVPPSVFLVHLQLSELYMIWIHTEIISTLGPFELILNTPSHHRVHHARNRKYIDKNYGGTFIIWDKLFGTFQPEDPQDPVAYGLVHPIESYNPFHLQFHHFRHILNQLKTATSFKHKLQILFYGPGWQPGDSSRLGTTENIPEIKQPVLYWSPDIPLTHTVYAVWHFGVTLCFYALVSNLHDNMSQLMVTFYIFVLLFSVTSIGLMLEGRSLAFFVEFARCLLFLLLNNQLLDGFALVPFDGVFRFDVFLLQRLLRYSFVASAVFCGFNLFNQFKFKLIKHI